VKTRVGLEQRLLLRLSLGNQPFSGEIGGFGGEQKELPGHEIVMSAISSTRFVFTDNAHGYE
jgi:hypothetical protein